MNDIEHWDAHATAGAATALRATNLTTAEHVRIITILRKKHGDNHDFTRADVEKLLRLAGHIR